MEGRRTTAAFAKATECLRRSTPLVQASRLGQELKVGLGSQQQRQRCASCRRAISRRCPAPARQGRRGLGGMVGVVRGDLRYSESATANRVDARAVCRMLTVH